MTKPCSKCKKELPISEFWKHNNIVGRYPSCRSCERNRRLQFLIQHPLCFRCGINKHMDGDRYCYPCSRIYKNRGEPRFRTRKTGLNWCSKCGIRERVSYHHMCHQCKMEYQNKTRAKRWHDRYKTNPIKQIETARAYATGLLARGKIRRGPCVFCGRQGTQFHHFDYERKTRNFADVCYPCHKKTHRLLNCLLTIRRLLM